MLEFRRRDALDRLHVRPPPPRKSPPEFDDPADLRRLECAAFDPNIRRSGPFQAQIDLSLLFEAQGGSPLTKDAGFAITSSARNWKVFD